MEYKRLHFFRTVIAFTEDKAMTDDSARSTAAELGLVTACPNHEDREATVRCTACLRPVCPECITTTDYGKFCSAKCRLGAIDHQARKADFLARDKPSMRLPLGLLIVLAPMIVAVIYGWKHQKELLSLYHHYFP